MCTSRQSHWKYASQSAVNMQRAEEVATPSEAERKNFDVGLVHFSIAQLGEERGEKRV